MNALTQHYVSAIAKKGDQMNLSVCECMYI